MRQENTHKKGGETMAIINRPISASLRFVDNDGDTIHSYHRINPSIQGENVDHFMNAISGLTGRTGSNAFLTVTTELLEIVA